MTFGGSSGGTSKIATSGDVALSNPTSGDVLSYDASVDKWKNSPGEVDSRTTLNTTFIETGTLMVKTGSTRYYFTSPATITGAHVSLGIAGTDASNTSKLSIDINKNGSTIFTNQTSRPSIGPGQHTEETVRLPAAEQRIVAAFDYLTVDVDSVCQTTPGSDLVVNIYYQLNQ